MKLFHPLLFVLPLYLVLTASAGRAADQWYELPVQDALDSPLAAEKLHAGVKLFVKGRAHPAVARDFGQFKSNKRSNAFKKTKETACKIAFISALISLQERAITEGGDGVVDIYSLTKFQTTSDPEKYNCLAGTMIANVVLMGKVVKFE